MARVLYRVSWVLLRPAKMHNRNLLGCAGVADSCLHWTWPHLRDKTPEDARVAAQLVVGDECHARHKALNGSCWCG